MADEHWIKRLTCAVTRLFRLWTRCSLED
jgi:hypothetical protein